MKNAYSLPANERTNVLLTVDSYMQKKDGIPSKPIVDLYKT